MKKTLFYFFICTTVSSCSSVDVDENKILYPVADSLLPARWKLVKEFADSIQDGDLVLRCGNDFTSESLRDFSQQEKLYSHSGIALQTDSGIFIYSNMAGDINPDEIMRSDRIDSFLNPMNNVVIGVYRYDITEIEKEKLRSLIMAHYQNKLKFDMNFDLATDDKMYCVEMIAKSIGAATGDRISFTKSMVNDDLKNKYLKMALKKKVLPSKKAADLREYLAIDNLYINPHCREVKKYVFGAPQKPIKFPSPEKDSN